MTASPSFRLVFAGTPEAAVPSLRALHAAGHDIAAVVTRPDAPQGRKRVLTPSPVAVEAERLGLPVIRAARLDDDATSEIVALDADLGVVVAYGGLVREPLLSAPAHGWINLHFSLLPRWRGAAPVQHALIAGDDELGTAVFRLVRELDAGDVYAQAPVPLPDDATAGEALAVLADAGAEQLAGVVAAIADGSAVAVPQSGEPTPAPKLRLEDGALDWTQPAGRILARWRGVTPEPGAHTTVGGGRVKVLRMERAPGAPGLAPGETASSKRGVLVGTRTDPLLVTRVQPSGRGPMDAADWLRGARDAVRFGA
ncbi:methionyl-tRNA formyltransferase [Microbacterium betulae]|uniref:Methionyl-tRNA formyltransferase n=1 Tax=Microbacterium betulae TaxID=2981139 RepID=A0AA97FF89_9MICO|nr:methionyl-tRNA formyltransferase [Microbacterium sp. AB]WOF21513.1 methionyl-tRNA formyltransferase [Microbacterium sp. AB]